MSQRGSGFARKASDQYMTPAWVYATLFSVMPIFGTIWEPACGEGTGVQVMRETSGHRVHIMASDIDARYSPDGQSWDFLDPKVQASYFLPEEGPYAIITNPPYGKGGRLAVAFVSAALSLTSIHRGRVAMLLPVDWDTRPKRQMFFEDFDGHITKIVLTERIRWTNLPQSKHGPSTHHQWVIWDHSRRGRDMRWLGRVAA